jgi:hypothetical protein
MVQTTKRALIKTIGRAKLKYEELQTILVEIEATINSRPITYCYDDGEEGQALTPAHFLIGKRLTSLPEISINQNMETELTKIWKRKQQIQNSFEIRWKKEYLMDLHNFHQRKQPKEGPSFEVNDVVIIADDNLRKQRWKLGKIVQVIHGRDGKIRTCLVKNELGNEIRRPVQLLHPLELKLLFQGGENVVNEDEPKQ